MPSLHLKLLPEFKSLIDQEKPLGQLGAALDKGTISHALLFAGIDGVGKNSAALMFAMACNCDAATGKRGPTAPADHGDADVPCGKCRSCRKILSGTHPDIIFIKPSGPFIKIKQIRDLCRRLIVKPFEADRRMVIISDAGAMNPEAGNALLKVLEEPPDRTTIILISATAFDLLPTIVSRCQHVRFNPIGLECMNAYLTTEYGIDFREAAIVSQMANGSLTRALSMMQTNWIERRDWLIDEITALPSRSIRMALVFAEKLAGKKGSLSDSLEIIKTWLRDLIVCRYSRENVINQDLKDKIQQVSQKIEIQTLLANIGAVQAAQKRIDANANLRLTLENLMIHMKRN